MEKKYILGLDQGGTKTHAVVADLDGNLIALGTGVGACHSVTGMDSAMNAAKQAIEGALRNAHTSLEEIALLAAGMTGVDWPYEAQLLRENLSRTLDFPQESIRVVNDGMIALRAGTTQPYGCILCAGTGLNCGVKHPDGREFLFGYYIKDADQGGGALGRRVAQAVYDAQSGLGEPTLLTELVLDYMGFAGAEEMLTEQTCGKGLDGKKLDQLPRIAEKAALAGDEVAKQLLHDFGCDMAKYVVAGLRKFGMLNDEVEVVLSGSVFKCRAPELMDAVRSVILQSAPKAVLKQSIYEPIVGAAMLALDAFGAPNMNNIDASARALHLLRG